MTGKSHTDPAATPFALEIMQHMNDACKRWKEATEHRLLAFTERRWSPRRINLPSACKSASASFAGITDKSYITNSYHVHVTEQIDAFEKLAFESQFQALSPGGAISYVEVPNMQNNLDAVLEVMKFIYDHIMYAELNTKSDYCQVCGFDGEIEIDEDRDGKLVWTCPQCGNTDQYEDERRPPHLRLHRNPVLEPGPDAGDPRPRSAFVKRNQPRLSAPLQRDGRGCFSFQTFKIAS